MHDLLTVFFEKLREKMFQIGINPENRFLYHGTSFHSDDLRNDLLLCVGSGKIELLHALLRKNGHKKYVVRFVYSDNGYMADLPLFIEAKHGGAVIKDWLPDDLS
jgi:hypothetical protein